jgi:amidase
MPTYRRVADLLLPASPVPTRIDRFAVATDIVDFVLGADGRRETERFVAGLGEQLEREADVILAPEQFEHRRSVFRIIQAFEVWRDHGAWIEANQPEFGHGVRERFEWAATVTSEVYEQAQVERRVIAEQVIALIPPDKVLAFPTVPSAAPLPGAEGEELEAYRLRSISMLCTAGLAGLPQLSLPLGTIGNLPFGLSILGSPGSDHALLALGETLMDQ